MVYARAVRLIRGYCIAMSDRISHVRGGVMVTSATLDQRQERAAVDSIETMIRLVSRAKGQRDPVAWLHDQLLDLRNVVTRTD